MAEDWINRHLHGLDSQLLDRIRAAENEMEWIRHASGDDLLAAAADSLGIASFESPFGDRSAREIGDLTHAELIEGLGPQFEAGTGIAEDLADQIQLHRAFASPRLVTEAVAEAVKAALAKMPTSAEDLKVGHNPGDVLDPFILAANYEMLAEQSMQRAVETSMSHKALMKIEDLVGNLHQNTIGMMRGNFRIPEPSGGRKDGKENLDPKRNPFPGADVGQVPLPEKPDVVRLFQVKSKTGSAKGGDAKRLGEQLGQLEATYGADTFYVAIVGNTLKGHRSRRGVERQSPDTAILVGNAALNELTQSSVGGELLLRVYQRAFRRAAEESGYRFGEVVAATIEAFEREVNEAGEGFLEIWLHDAIGGEGSQQDSRAEGGSQLSL